jgi:glycosyltransferase involved in cell wall biosynthesis
MRSKGLWTVDLAAQTVPVGNALERGRTRDQVAVSIIIPTLNEAGNLPYVLNTIPNWVHEIVIVDGRSDDDTERIAKVLRQDIRIVHELKRGKGAAMKAGLYAAKGDILIALDADGSMDGAEIGAFTDAMLAGADYVKGSRFAPGAGSSDITKFRRFGDGSICFLLRVLFGAHYTDATYGYIGVWADRLDYLGIDTDGFEVETLIGIRAQRARLRIAEVPCYEANRIHGVSNLNALRDGLRILRVIVSERLRRYRVLAS